MFRVEVKKNGKWVKAPLPDMDTELDAYRVASAYYGEAMWCGAMDDNEGVVRVIPLPAP